MDEVLVTKIISEVLKNTGKKIAASGITLDLAKRLAGVVEEKAAEMGVKAVVSISDMRARPVLTECMDDSYIASFDIAQNKAYTTVALKMPTSKLKTLAAPGGELYGIQHTNNGQIVIFGGGDPLTYNGSIIGGIGVSGGTEEEDTFLSNYGAIAFDKIMKGE